MRKSLLAIAVAIIVVWMADYLNAQQQKATNGRRADGRKAIFHFRYVGNKHEPQVEVEPTSGNAFRAPNFRVTTETSTIDITPYRDRRLTVRTGDMTFITGNFSVQTDGNKLALSIMREKGSLPSTRQ